MESAWRARGVGVALTRSDQREEEEEEEEGERKARGEVHEALAWRWGLASSLWCGPVWAGRHGWRSWIALRVQVRVRHGTEIGRSILGQQLARCCRVFVFVFFSISYL